MKDKAQEELQGILTLMVYLLIQQKLQKRQ